MKKLCLVFGMLVLVFSVMILGSVIIRNAVAGIPFRFYRDEDITPERLNAAFDIATDGFSGTFTVMTPDSVIVTLTFDSGRLLTAE